MIISFIQTVEERFFMSFFSHIKFKVLIGALVVFGGLSLKSCLAEGNSSLPNQTHNDVSVAPTRMSMVK